MYLRIFSIPNIFKSSSLSLYLPRCPSSWPTFPEETRYHLTLNLLDRLSELAREESLGDQLETCVSALGSLLMSLGSDRDESDPDDMSIEDEKQNTFSFKQCFEKLTTTLSNLPNKKLHQMFDVFLKKTGSTTAIHPGLFHLATLYKIVLLNEKNNVTLNQLTFSTGLIPIIWQKMENLPKEDSLESLAKIGDEKKQPDLATVLWMFCTFYSHLLKLIDDQEFFENGVFTIEQIMRMILILKKVGYRLCCNSINQKTSSSSLEKALQSLLATLYDRNSRRPFMPSEMWQEGEHDLDLKDLEENPLMMRLLTEFPFVISFQTRVKIFRKFVKKDQHANSRSRGRSLITIRRNYVFEDSFDGLSRLSTNELKSTIRVEFINQQGLQEAGVDGGGVFKEFLTTLAKVAFDSQYGLFKQTDQRLLYPNPASRVVHGEYHLNYFNFLGKVLGKALYESIHVDVPFANFFLAKLLQKGNTVDVNNLVYLDPILHKNLMKLKHYRGNVEEDFGLTFSITENEFGEGTQRELIRGGKDLAVTNDNRIKYIYSAAYYFLHQQISEQSEAFLTGFYEIIDRQWLHMFNQDELQLLIAGDPGSIDINDLRANTVYGPGYDDNHLTIVLFWDVLSKLSAQDQRVFLKFVTSSSRPPLLGFANLYPKFCILQSVDLDHLPTSSTCMNLLKIAPYSDRKTLEDKLLYAIHSGAGFELS
eukprot:TRINITY_DN4316_c0_g1_i2.p1 TRINITY_DN4316_c0_g1~~TRINITY_DN4316_c0_g1_i2.p1  ORF type:complete len:704 (+),score=78.63 TRINITY_DN4316_c0_g1_i2:1041-3152(+)